MTRLGTPATSFLWWSLIFKCIPDQRFLCWNNDYCWFACFIASDDWQPGWYVWYVNNILLFSNISCLNVCKYSLPEMYSKKCTFPLVIICSQCAYFIPTKVFPNFRGKMMLMCLIMVMYFLASIYIYGNLRTPVSYLMLHCHLLARR